MDSFTVVLRSQGEEPRRIPASSLLEAVRLWCEFRDDNRLRPHDMSLDCGYVYQDDRKVAQISYSGRLWDTSPRDRLRSGSAEDKNERDEAKAAGKPWHAFKPLMLQATEEVTEQPQEQLLAA